MIHRKARNASYGKLRLRHGAPLVDVEEVPAAV